ncbi:MAG TPA: ankyrin repeat domain-containing protein [Gemmatimonadaceae bacterium]|nr:ankyrin repeat domain-containing protein [Gemmatimonadaceae bacterium]
MTDTSDPRDAFLRAAFWHGGLADAEAIRAEHPDITGSSIHVAATLGDDAAVRRFIGEDAANATATGGPRDAEPLVYLCFSRYLAYDASRSDAFLRTATALLDAGADPNAGFFDSEHTPHPEWESAIYGAAGVAFHAGLTALLLDRGADPNDAETPYHAPETYDNGALTVLLGSGKLDEQSLNTMLVRKADWHDLEGMRLCLDHGADPNFMGRWGRTALHHAVLSDNRLEIVELLLDRGADPTLVATNLGHGGPPRPGHSAIALAARRGRADILDLMARRGVPILLEGVDRLIAACARGEGLEAQTLAAAEPESLKQLLAEGGAVLVEFAGNDNAVGAALLLELGIPVDAPHAIGESYFGTTAATTALHAAAWRAAHDTMDMLIARGADVNARDGNGNTPLMLAVRACVDSYWSNRRSPRSVKALLGAGASKSGVSAPTGYAAIDELLRD